MKMSVKEYHHLIKKNPKYNNRKTIYNGIVFDSKKEADYAKHLEYLKHAHEEKDRVVRVEYQVPFAIIVSRKNVGTYFADFRVTYHDLRQEVIDVKGGKATKTPLYRFKKRCVEALYEIIIKEV